MKVIPQTAAKTAKQHKLERSYDGEHIINSDDNLTRQFYEAAFELALELGLLCTDTGRVIKISESELKEGLKRAPRSLTLGSSREAKTLQARNPEDGKRPMFMAPLALVVAEDLWVPLMAAIASQPDVDLFQGASLTTVLGREVRSGTPYELIAGKMHADMHQRAMILAGRQGIGATAVSSSVTFLGQAGGFGVPGGFDALADAALVLTPSEMKVNYHLLNKIGHAIAFNSKLRVSGHSFIGGFSGGVETTVLVNIATNLLHVAALLSDIPGGAIYDIHYNGTCGREALWGESVAVQAKTRAGLMWSSLASQVAGPCTEMLLYETAAGMINLSCSGVSYSVGPRSAGGKYPDYLTPLECQFSGEVLHACPGMKRIEADEIVKSLIPKYEKLLANPPKGKSVRECYDLNENKPSEEWSLVNRRVRKELIDQGVPIGN